MSIEEGDIVVTPGGNVEKVLMYKKDHCRGISLSNSPNRWWPPEDLIKVNKPLRIRVDSEDEAEFVVSRAKEAGFDAGKYDFCDTNIVSLKPYADDNRNARWNYLPNCSDHDLTFADYDQWTAWLQFHAEDDECEDCRHLKEKATQQPHRSIPVYCPEYDSALDTDDCTESDEYDEAKTMKETAHNSWMFDDDSDEYDEPEENDFNLKNINLIEVEFERSNFDDLISDLREVGFEGKILSPDGAALLYLNEKKFIESYNPDVPSIQYKSEIFDELLENFSSDYDCDICEDTGILGGGVTKFECPKCKDISEEETVSQNDDNLVFNWDEPSPENERWLSVLKEGVESGSIPASRLGFDDSDSMGDGFKILIEQIEDLQDEVTDWKNWVDKLSSHLCKKNEEFNRLENRIEFAIQEMESFNNVNFDYFISILKEDIDDV